MIALPARRDALAIAATEFRFGTFAIFALADGFMFVAAIAAIVSEIAHPLSVEKKEFFNF